MLRTETLERAMSLSYSHGREFLDEVRPILEQHDTALLARYLAVHHPHDNLRDLLATGHDEAVKMALVCLSVTGDMSDNAAIAALLHSDDPVTAAVAEHALWSIWFRGADEQARCELDAAVRLIGNGMLDEAISCLTKLLRAYPTFAEAYNQRAIAWFLKEDYVHSAADCRQTLRLNPWHFGAMAGLGHCYASLGKLEMALEVYRSALQLHPRFEGIRQSISQIRNGLGESPAPSTSAADEWNPPRAAR
jgi:tetratricopeptide (TPR) repeat protein